MSHDCYCCRRAPRRSINTRTVCAGTDAGDELGLERGQRVRVCQRCFGRLANSVADTAAWRAEKGLERRPGNRPGFLSGGFKG